eukprot:6341975-Amphidinium_carterae.1
MSVRKVVHEGMLRPWRQARRKTANSISEKSATYNQDKSHKYFSEDEARSFPMDPQTKLQVFRKRQTLETKSWE